jgi:hypothetical protein
VTEIGPGDSTTGTEEFDAASVLARELPRTSSLIRPTRYNFNPAAGDIEAGPVGPAAYDDARNAAAAIARIPRIRAYRFGDGTVSGTLGGNPAPFKVTASVPSVFMISQWAVGGTSLGLTRINFAPTPENSAPDINSNNNGDLSWQAGFGNIAFLPSPGDYWIVLSASIAPTADRALWMMIDATNPEVAEVYQRLTARRPNEVHYISDVTLGALGTAILVPNTESGTKTAVVVTNTTAAAARLAWGGSPPSGTSGETILGNSRIVYEGPTLPEGELRAFSTAGTVLSVSVYSQDFGRV